MQKRQRRSRTGVGRRAQVSGLVEWLESRALLAATIAPPGSSSGQLAEHVPGEILVQFRPQVNENSTTAVQTAIGGEVLQTIHTRAMMRSGSGVLQRISIAPGLSIAVVATLKASRTPLFGVQRRTFCLSRLQAMVALMVSATTTTPLPTIHRTTTPRSPPPRKRLPAMTQS